MLYFLAYIGRDLPVEYLEAYWREEVSVNINLTVGPRKQQSRAEVNNGGCGGKS